MNEEKVPTPVDELEGRGESGSSPFDGEDSVAEALHLSNLAPLEKLAAPLAAPSVGPLPVSTRYRILREVGRGGMGVVYEAFDPELNRKVALKIVRDFPGASETAWRRLRREANAGFSVYHPNVVTILEEGETDGRPHLVMEWIEGETLASLLKHRPVDPLSLLPLLEQAARGVAAAHERGIVHRDLKPANILIEESGTAKVADFGLAVAPGKDTRFTRTGAILGTPPYMAPEQLEGGGSTPRSDVYSLGSILYELLTGAPPYGHGSTFEIIAERISTERLVPPSERNPSMPRDLDTITLKALDREPERRYPTATEFAEDLLRFREGRPILATLTGDDDLDKIGRLWRIEEKLKPVRTGLREAQPFLYVKHIDIREIFSKVETSLEVLRKLLQDPRHAELGELWSILGTGLHFIGDLRPSLKALKNSVQRSPGNGRDRFRIARISLRLSSSCRDLPESPSSKSLASARRLADSARLSLQQIASEWSGMEDRERDLLETYRTCVDGQRDETIRRCREGIARFGDAMGSEEYWLLLASLQQPEDAIESCRKALDHAPHSDWAYGLRGSARIKRKEFDLAVRDYSEAIRINPRFDHAYACRSLCWFQRGNFDRGIADANEAARLSPKTTPGAEDPGDIR